MRLRRTIRSYRNELVRRIAAIPGTPAERSQHLIQFNAIGRSHRRRRFVPSRRKFLSLQEARRHRDWVEGQDAGIAKRLRRLLRRDEQPGAATPLRSLRRTAQRSLLLTSIAYVETLVRIRTIERRVLARRR